ncbi:T9SS type A sorting domain-containing protein [Flavobacteriaceae bacterium]|nr:T9SS type A sorting domain-containing protein [Flavobacteriaceae bacterium]
MIKIFHTSRIPKKIELIFFLFFTSIVYSQNNYYVSSTNGSNSNDGLSESSPFLTINKGISEVSEGGTVYVMNGTYRNVGYGSVDPSTNTNMNNPHVATINKSGSEGAYITIRNLEGHEPKIEFDGRGGIVISDYMNYIIIEGFEVEGPAANITYDQAIADREYKVLAASDENDNITYNHTYFSGKGIWGGYKAHNNIIIRNNKVYNCTGSGIRFNDSDHITIENNEVFNCTWWTSSASSAIVYAETIAVDGDNTTDIKMIMRGNLVYNNWNRIPFYVTQLPDNSGNTNPNYGTADYNNILDGQGLYVTRSDDSYIGTFLFENNVCVNNGKNGINFDNSLGASAIYQNNTLYYNGVHEIIQDLSVAEGNPAHRGQKVGGIKANKVQNATVVNNIVVTRDNEFSALSLNNIDNPETVDPETGEPDYDGIKIATNNIFLNGTVAYPGNQEPANLINIDPEFVNVPSVVNGAIDINQTNFKLAEGSPAIDAGNTNYSPSTDIDGEPRPANITNAISYSSFENSTDGWTQFGATIAISPDESVTGNNSLFTSDRQYNYSSPRLFLDGLLTIDDTYTFYVSVKLAENASGTSDITIKNTLNDEVTYTNLLESPTTVSDNEWTALSGDYTYTGSDQIFVYVKGPTQAQGGGDFYIDDFSLVPQGSPPVNFNDISDVVDIGAYEFSPALSLDDTTSSIPPVINAYPNPATNKITLSEKFSKNQLILFDLLGKNYPIKLMDNFNSSTNIDISNLSSGLYFVKIIKDNRVKSIKFIKE